MKVRLIPGFDGFYKIREDGKKIWSSHKRGGNTVGERGPWKLMKIGQDKDGYPQVELWKDGVGSRRKVHRLVLEAFIGPCPPSMECRHKDNNPANNNRTNIEWATKSVNMLDKRENGTSKNNQGKRNGNVKLTEKLVLQIRKKYKTGKYSQEKLGRIYGVQQPTILKIVRFQRWAHI